MSHAVPYPGKKKQISSKNRSKENARAKKHPARRPYDQILFSVTVALVVIGLFAVFTASAMQADLETGSTFSTLLKQTIAVVVGSFGLFFGSQFFFERWKKLARPLAFIALALLAFTAIAGLSANGSERWIKLPMGFQFQPSDFAKLTAIFLMAQATTQHKNLLNGNSIANLALVTLMSVFIVKQPNLSVTIIIGIMTLGILFVAGMPRYLFFSIIPAMGAGVAYVIANNTYQLDRIKGWLDPWQYPGDEGYNIIQSYFAVGSGGLFGVGLGNSIQKLHYLPFQHTDFIFSIICEEWGFIGASIVIGLFLVLAWRGFQIALQSPSSFGRMLAFGLTLAIILQALINIAVTLGILPVTGVTLPLISYGGSSMIITLSMIGILLNISRYNKPRVPFSAEKQNTPDPVSASKRLSAYHQPEEQPL